MTQGNDLVLVCRKLVEILQWSECPVTALMCERMQSDTTGTLAHAYTKK